MVPRHFYPHELEVPSATDDDRWELHRVASSGSLLEVVKYLVEEKGMDPKATNKKGVTVLQVAAKSGNLELVQYLVEKGADPNEKDNYDMTVLHWAANYGNLELVQYLVNEHKADPNAADDDYKKVLHYAAYSGNLELVQYLIEKVHIMITARQSFTMQHTLVI